MAVLLRVFIHVSRLKRYAGESTGAPRKECGKGYGERRYFLNQKANAIVGGTIFLKGMLLGYFPPFSQAGMVRSSVLKPTFAKRRACYWRQFFPLI
jgi:hypothetical protein